MIGDIYPPSIYNGGDNVSKIMCGIEQVWPIYNATIYMQVVDEAGKILMPKTQCILHPNGSIDNLPSQIGKGIFDGVVVVTPSPQSFVDMECKTAEITQPAGPKYIYLNHDDGTGRVMIKNGVFAIRDYEATIVWVMKYTKSYQDIWINVSQLASPRDARDFTINMHVGELPASSGYYITQWDGTNVVIYLKPIVSGDEYSTYDSNMDSTIQRGYDSTNKAFKIVVPRTAFEEGHKQANTLTVAYKPIGDGNIKFTFKEDLYDSAGKRWGWKYTENCTVTKDGVLTTEHSEAPLRAYRSGDNVKVEFGYVSGYSLTYTISPMPTGATRSGDTWIIPRSSFTSWCPEVTVTRVGHQI